MLMLARENYSETDTVYLVIVINQAFAIAAEQAD